MRLLFPDSTAWIGDTKGRFLAPLGNSFIVTSEGNPPDPSAYKAGGGPIIENRVSTNGAVLGVRDDWQMHESPIDNTIFTLGGPNDNWTWTDVNGSAHGLAFTDLDYFVYRDTRGHFWAQHWTTSKWLLVELDATGTTEAPKTIDLGEDSVTALVPACDGAIWLSANSGALVRMVGSERKQVVRQLLPANTSANWLPASDGSLWIFQHTRTGDFTGYTTVRRFDASGAVGDATQITEDQAMSATVGPDGALWSLGLAGLYRLGLDGDLHLYQWGRQLPRPQPSYEELDFGPDGHLWYVCGRRDICWVSLDGR